jgi:hypothetical protein
VDIHGKRRQMFKSIGERLIVELKLASEGDTDTDIQGRAGEAAFRKWLSQQLPSRFHAVTGAVLSSKHPPTTERDCIVFDAGECPSFGQSGDQPDLLPIEGVVGAIEINTGRSGATYSKLLHDCRKLSEIGRLSRESRPPRSDIVKLGPSPIPNTATIPDEIFVSQRKFVTTPALYLFAEDIQGSLPELAQRVARHNKSVEVSASVGGVFVLNAGFILHIKSEDFWLFSRVTGFPLAYMEAEPWEVLLKLMSVIWVRIWRETDKCVGLGPYYADKTYFTEVELPRRVIIDDPDYSLQQEEGFVPVVPSVSQRDIVNPLPSGNR